ncbi:MAG: metal-dependent transcriptional regulator [Candidatus Bathyarchaeota archaeon]|nr:metal-dependent transcriptional regulator [Candidatus Bathyarchaeota archaeon]
MNDAGPVARLNVTEETYVETIDALLNTRGYAVVTDIAKELNVKSPSVTSMLKKLDSLGFVKYTPYRNVFLTQKGQSLATFLKKRQTSLQTFLNLLGVDEKTAEEDACAVEHIVHGSTSEKLSKFVEFVQTTPQGTNWLDCFKTYEKLGNCPYPACPFINKKCSNPQTPQKSS